MVAKAGARKGIDAVPWLFAFYLFALSGASLVIGAHDAALAHANLGVTAPGAILLALGVLFFFAACKLIALGRRTLWSGPTRPPCSRLVVGALALSTFVGLYVFFSGLKGAGTQRLIVLAVALVALAAAGVGLWYFGDEVDVTAARVGAALLALVGTIVGVGQFWYANQYLPTRAGRAVVLSVGLERIGRQGNFDVLRAKVDLQDIGGRSVSVLGSAYTLTGSRVVRCRRPAQVDQVDSYFKKFLVDPQKIRFMRTEGEESPTVLAAGKFVGDGRRLDPGVPSSRTFVFLAPRRFQLLRFRATVFAISSSVQLSQRKRPKLLRFPPSDNELYGFWHVDDDSWFHDLVLGRGRWVVIRYELVNILRPKDTQVDPALRVTARLPDPTWSERRPNQKEVEELFNHPQPSDASDAFSDAELPGAPVADPTAGDLKELPFNCHYPAVARHLQPPQR